MVSHQGIANLFLGEKLDVMEIFFDITRDHFAVTILEPVLCMIPATRRRDILPPDRDPDSD
jgi:hypothetical protein